MSRDRLLVIYDERDLGEFIAEVAEGLGFEALATDRSTEFWAAYARATPQVVVLDLMMPEEDGVEILRTLAERACQASILVISAADPRVVATVRRLGEARGLRMLGALHKPIEIGALEEALAPAVRKG